MAERSNTRTFHRLYRGTMMIYKAIGLFNRNKIFNIILFGIYSFFLLLTTLNAQVIKLGTLAPKGSPWYNALKETGQEWAKLSNGKVRLRIYPGGVAGDDPDMIRKMRIGQLHAAALTTSGMGFIYPDITAITFPNNIKTNEELEFVIKKAGPYFEEQIWKKGFKVLSWNNAGWVHFFSKNPVITPDDMKKQKLFFWGSETLYEEALKKAGFHPVPLSVTDLMPGLRTGLVNAFAATPQVSLAFQWYSLAKNMCGLRWQPLPGIIVMSKRAWNRIPKNLQPQLIESMNKFSSRLWSEIADLEEESIAAMKKHGLKVNEISGDAANEWQNIVKEKLFPVFLGHRFSKEAFDKVQNALEEYRKINN